MIGRRIGPYRIDELLGIGGMGEVFLATDKDSDTQVAMKRLPPEAAVDENLRRRFKREAEAASMLDHPAIVNFVDLFESREGHWIVMEYVDGDCLADLIDREGPLSPYVVVDLVRQIATGLDAAHGQGIVHRDLKTENVLIDVSGRARILDFGLAKHLFREESGVTLTLDGTMVGTCRSMAPEQALAEPVDERTDLFSLGVLMYEALTGVSPFVATTPLQTVALIVSQAHMPVVERNPRVPADLADLVESLLEKEMDDRPRSAAEVIDVLDQVRPPRGLGALTEKLRQSTSVWILLLLLLAAVAGLAIVFLQPGGTP